MTPITDAELEQVRAAMVDAELAEVRAAKCENDHV